MGAYKTSTNEAVRLNRFLAVTPPPLQGGSRPHAT